MNQSEKQEIKIASKELMKSIGSLILKTMECAGMFIILVYTTKDLINEIKSLF